MDGGPSDNLDSVSGHCGIIRKENEDYIEFHNSPHFPFNNCKLIKLTCLEVHVAFSDCRICMQVAIYANDFAIQT